MREARLIFPLFDNDQAPLFGALHDIERELFQAFGGFTMHDATGCWTKPDGVGQRETVRVFVIAMACTKDNTAKLRHIAQMAAIAGHQECVYMCSPYGGVEFVEPPAAIATHRYGDHAQSPLGWDKVEPGPEQLDDVPAGNVLRNNVVSLAEYRQGGQSAPSNDNSE